MSTPNASEGQNGDQREKTRGEIEVLILITGLILTPLLYLWQQALTVLQVALPQWQTYLTSRLGSQYSFDAVLASYFSPFGLSRALPVDLLILAYDSAVVLATLALLIFGASLVAIERRDVKRVEKLVQKGRACLNVVLVLIIFFAIFHLFTTMIFPWRLLFGMEDLWVAIGIALLIAVALKKWLNRYINELIIIGTNEKTKT